ncbi:hypothetical protein MASR2M15_23970 [Anaerolineales bacterium]
MPSLNTFGAILTYTIELEKQVQGYYQSMGKEDLAQEADKRRDRLERVRRENVVEITLEPIDGLDEANYDFDFNDASEAGQKKIAQEATRLYEEVAEKINVRQAQRMLERCGSEYAELI